jgi:hypothetical protein
MGELRVIVFTKLVVGTTVVFQFTSCPYVCYVPQNCKARSCDKFLTFLTNERDSNNPAVISFFGMSSSTAHY